MFKKDACSSESKILELYLLMNLYNRHPIIVTVSNKFFPNPLRRPSYGDFHQVKTRFLSSSNNVRLIVGAGKIR
jgi:hypothetical protein